MIESSHLQEFARLNAEIAYISCPAVEKHLTTSRILVMEYVEGIPIDHEEELRSLGYDMHEIAQKLAEYYKLPMYDHNLLDEVAASMNVSSKELAEFDEKRRNKFLYRSVMGMNSSPADNVARMQFDYIKKKAEAGESFVIVGRCSEIVLKDNPHLISIFVLGDREAKIERVMRIYELDARHAEERMIEKDRRRKSYHNSHCKVKWGDSRNYDLSINSSKLGVEETVESLKNYIDARVAHK